MKIDKPGKPLPASSTGAGVTHTPGKGKSAPVASVQPSSSTNVSLGSTSTQFNSMESDMANVPIVDAAKVAQIKQAISDGHFTVNSGVVAEHLISTVRNLLGGGHKS